MTSEWIFKYNLHQFSVLFFCNASIWHMYARFLYSYWVDERIDIYTRKSILQQINLFVRLFVALSFVLIIWFDHFDYRFQDYVKTNSVSESKEIALMKYLLWLCSFFKFNINLYLLKSQNSLPITSKMGGMQRRIFVIFPQGSFWFKP